MQAIACYDSSFLRNSIHINSISLGSGLAVGCATYYIIKSGTDITVTAVKTSIHAGTAVLEQTVNPEIISICSNITSYTAETVINTAGNTIAVIGGVLAGVSATCAMMVCTKLIDTIRAVSVKANIDSITIKDEDDFQVLIYDIQPGVLSDE